MTFLSLAGRRILVLHPDFFGVDMALVSALRGLGAAVESWSTRPSKSTLSRACLRLAPAISESVIAPVLNKHISVLESNNFDTVVVLKSEGCSIAVLKNLRKKLSHAKFHLYLFDSARNQPNILAKAKIFDRVLSFDPVDCEEHSDWLYRPLFAADNYWRVASKGATSVYSLSSYHPERVCVLGCFAKNASRARIDNSHDLFMRGWTDSIRTICTPIRPPVKIIRAPLPAEEVTNRFAKHCAILDIHHPRQTGLTLRTFEALASGRKLITTNAHIRNHDFFDPTRIFVMNRESPIVDPTFLRQEQDNTSNSRLPEHYSARRWAADIAFGEVCR